MAFFPCDFGPHPNRKGRNQNLYVGVVSGEDATRWSLRLCQIHFADVQEHLAQFEVVWTDDAAGFFGAVHSCLACLQPAGEVDWQLFVSSYPANNERKDYWAKLHINCEVPAYLKEPTHRLARARMTAQSHQA